MAGEEKILPLYSQPQRDRFVNTVRSGNGRYHRIQVAVAHSGSCRTMAIDSESFRELRACPERKSCPETYRSWGFFGTLNELMLRSEEATRLLFNAQRSTSNAQHFKSEWFY